MCAKNFTFVLLASFFLISVWSILFPPVYSGQLIPFLPIFLIGSIGAYVSEYLERSSFSDKVLKNKILNVIAIISFLSFLVLIPAFFNLIFDQNISNTRFHNSFILFAVLSVSLTLSLVHGDGVVKKVMESKIFTFWGKVSFSAYLLHLIVLRFDFFFSDNSALNLLLFFILTALISFVSYRYLELPLSKISRLTKP